MIKRAVWDMPWWLPHSPQSYFILFKNSPRSSTGKQECYERCKKLLRNWKLVGIAVREKTEETQLESWRCGSPQRNQLLKTRGRIRVSGSTCHNGEVGQCFRSLGASWQLLCPPLMPGCIDRWPSQSRLDIRLSQLRKAASIRIAKKLYIQIINYMP